uniref:N-lysine methyltransferase SETD6 isoform X2 n=1 Tax=Halichoerus grypus TaxID=9711 RepID=UPI001659AFDC|nr:N-lysine methyltransferase SETD6 isoform X2 [Halichoerus grypus]
MATQAKRRRVSRGGRERGPSVSSSLPRPQCGPAPLLPRLRGSLAALRVPSPTQSPCSARTSVSSRVPRVLRGGLSPRRSLVPGGWACGRWRRGPGPGGRFPELVPAGGAGAESQGGGEPEGHGGRLRHGGPGERAARGAAVRRAAGRAPVAAHLLHRRPAGARARRAAEPVGLGAAAAGAAARAAGPGLALEPLLCALAGAGPLGAPHVLARGGAPATAAGHRRPGGRGEGLGQHPQRVPFHRVTLHGSPPGSFQPQGPLPGTLPPARGSCDGLQNCLRMVATQPIPKGHEIFNTYGQMANWQLIHMYGFVEPYPDNTDDTADIQMVTVREAALQGTKAEAERLLLYERWDFLCKLEMVGEEGAFVIGREEVLTEEELTSTLKVLCMPAEEFREFKEKDGRGDDKREEDSLTITNIPNLKASWKQLLRDSVLLTLQTYATDLKSEQDLLSNKEVYTKLSWREQQALQVRYGQKMILHQLLELTS